MRVLDADRVPGFAPADDFAVFCEAVRALCGMDLLQYRRAQMERRIRTWTERRGTDDLAVCARRLRVDPAELDAFLDRVTINVSQLWRHPEQWDALAGTILPELARRGGVRAWSAGCSHGAEAYTLAAACREAIPEARVEIVGTDLDHRMVERARAGTFSPEDARGVPRRSLERFFPGGRATEEVRDALHARLVEALKPGGYLVVGTSERVAHARALGLTSPFHFIYRKG